MGSVCICQEQEPKRALFMQIRFCGEAVTMVMLSLVAYITCSFISTVYHVLSWDEP